MNDAARARLGDFIKAYGPSVCNTPTMCQIMLNQYCGSYPAEMQALNKALTSGTVDRLLKANAREDWEALSAPLVKELANGGMAEADAAWVIESWGRVLGKHPDGLPVAAEPTIHALSEPEKSPEEQAIASKAAGHTLLVAGSGAAGGALGAMLGAFAIAIMASGVVDTVRPEASQTANVVLAVVVLVKGLFGAIGGGAGGAAGWLLGKGGGSRPWGAVKGCFGAAFLAGGLSGRYGNPIVVFLSTFAATTGASLTGAYHTS